MVIRNEYLSASINLLGAELNSLKNKANRQFMWSGGKKFWNKHSPILFPIVGSLKNNIYRYNNTEYTLPRHGFAREMPFSILKKNNKSVYLCLDTNEKTLENYPFRFALEIGYILKENSLVVQYKVTNKGDVPMPFSIGGHPAFATGVLDKCSLEFPKTTSLRYNLLDNGLLSASTEVLKLNDGKLDLNYKLFERDALVFKNIEPKSVKIYKKSEPLLQVSYKNFPDLGIWTVKDAPFICIEPWFGHADFTTATGDILKKVGIVILPANGVFRAEYKIDILAQ